MTIRKLLLPTLIAAALAVPQAYAQNTGAQKPKATADADARADTADARKDQGKKQDPKAQAPKKDVKPRAEAEEEQPDEPEEDDR